MKKLLSSLMVACLMFVATISTVGAVGSITADEQKIIDALEAGVTVDGVKVNLKAADINAAKNYLTNNDVTAAQVTTILNNIEGAKSYMQTNHIKDIASIKGAHATAILGFAQAAADVLGLTIKVVLMVLSLFTKVAKLFIQLQTLSKRLVMISLKLL